MESNKKSGTLKEIKQSRKILVVLLIIIIIIIVIIVGYLILIRQNKTSSSIPSQQLITILPTTTPETTTVPYETLKSNIVEKFAGSSPKEWSETATGVETHFKTDQKVIALTFDACGGSGGSGYDKKIIDVLKTENIPATLFINSRWIDANKSAFKDLVDNLQFEIENHGTQHVPCSVSGQSAYNITGTKSVAEVVDEIDLNAQKILTFTGHKSSFYRAGTAYTDEICPQIAKELGENVVGFSVLGDAGGTYSADKVEKALLLSPPGSIVILHMNRPGSGTADGLIAAILKLKQMEVGFVKLSDVDLE